MVADRVKAWIRAIERLVDLRARPVQYKSDEVLPDSS
jgi:hypothetical protein